MANSYIAVSYKVTLTGHHIDIETGVVNFTQAETVLVSRYSFILSLVEFITEPKY